MIIRNFFRISGHCVQKPDLQVSGESVAAPDYVNLMKYIPGYFVILYCSRGLRRSEGLEHGDDYFVSVFGTCKILMILFSSAKQRQG